MSQNIKKFLLFALLGGLMGCSSGNQTQNNNKLALSFNFDEHEAALTLNDAINEQQYVDYVFNQENQDKIFKPATDPIYRKGVKGDALYMDGFSTRLNLKKYATPKKTITFSAWVAPRGFENLVNYNDDSIARGHPRLTSIINKGNIGLGEGFLFGYGRLGLWGLQLALYNAETGEDVVVGFYDPIHSLELYEWNHISATFDGNTGYICLMFNGEVSYESYLPDLVNTSIISTNENLYIGYYTDPMYEFGCNRQLPAGLLDEVKIYNDALTPKQIKNYYASFLNEGEHPSLDYDNVKEDRAQYEGDRYRPIYHGLPSAVWMNEPHAPIYYKGRYHLFYQHNPIGPYWSQIRWGHLVSDDMIHWESVKDAVAPQKGVCPEGVWTGGSVIGPDGTPWLAITAGTNRSTWSGQNVAFAHCVDPNDPNLTDWVVEDTVVITQPSDDSQGERDQFRDPFVWEDDGVYYMLISTSIPGWDKGGSGNIYVSKDMRNWEYKGYLYECPFLEYPEQGSHWECVILLPVTTEDGKHTKYVLFDCPQYTVDGYVVDCYYWVGTFDKNTYRFIPDNHKPQLFDLGRGIYTGQTGFCYRTEDQIASGVPYESGRTVLFALEQGKAAGTEQNIQSGWAHSLAMPVDLYLSDNLSTLVRRPIKEMASLYDNVLYEYSGENISFETMNQNIANIRGDTIEIKASISLNPTSEQYNSGLYVRYNPNTVNGETERTALTFNENGFYINRTLSTLTSNVEKIDSYTYYSNKKQYDLTILLDRSSLEVYIDDIITFTTRIYPKYGNSDYLKFFDNNGGLSINNMKVTSMKSAYYETVTPSYYGNTGNLGE